MKTNINMFLFDMEHFLSDIMGSRYLHIKKVYFFVGHPVCWFCPKPHVEPDSPQRPLRRQSWKWQARTMPSNKKYCVMPNLITRRKKVWVKKRHISIVEFNFTSTTSYRSLKNQKGAIFFAEVVFGLSSFLFILTSCHLTPFTVM